MKISKRDGTQERQLLTAAIVSKDVLARIVPVWNGELFRSPFANVIAKWCVEHFQEYGEAPGRSIEGIYDNWAADGGDEANAELIGALLGSLSDEHEALDEINVPYLVDGAEAYFNKIKCRRLADAITSHIDNGNLDSAVSAIEGFGKAEMSGSFGVDVLMDEQAIQDAFNEKYHQILSYPDTMNRFFKQQLARDAFIGFMGPEKRGKSWWLVDAAWRGMLQRRKVAFFAIGDMSQNQMMRRFMCRASRRPLKACRYKVPTRLSIAFDGEEGEEGGGLSVDVSHDSKREKEGLGWKTAAKKAARLQKLKVKSKTSYLKLITRPADTMSVEDVEAQLLQWSYSGWSPDIIVIDYADILAMPYQMDQRDKINRTWAKMRGLSMKYHCLVITATQSDAAGGDTAILSRRNFSEDKRKFAHVTGMIGINQTTEEKELGIQRLNWLALREAAYSEIECLYVAGCLEIGNPAIRGRYPYKNR